MTFFTDQLQVKSAAVLWILSRIIPYCRNGFKLVSIISNCAVYRIHLLYRELAATVPNAQIKKPFIIDPKPIIFKLTFAEPVNFPTFASRFGGRVCAKDTERRF